MIGDVKKFVEMDRGMLEGILTALQEGTEIAVVIPELQGRFQALISSFIDLSEDSKAMSDLNVSMNDVMSLKAKCEMLIENLVVPEGEIPYETWRARILKLMDPFQRQFEVQLDVTHISSDSSSNDLPISDEEIQFDYRDLFTPDEKD